MNISYHATLHIINTPFSLLQVPVNIAHQGGDNQGDLLTPHTLNFDRPIDEIVARQQMLLDRDKYSETEYKNMTDYISHGYYVIKNICASNLN